MDPILADDTTSEWLRYEWRRLRRQVRKAWGLLKWQLWGRHYAQESVCLWEQRRLLRRRPDGQVRDD
jgi:hypothetical protein